MFLRLTGVRESMLNTPFSLDVAIYNAPCHPGFTASAAASIRAGGLETCFHTFDAKLKPLKAESN